MSSLLISSIAAVVAFFLSVLEAKISKSERSNSANFKIASLVFTIVLGVTMVNPGKSSNILSGVSGVSGVINTGNPDW
jgi:hypothetical protein